jgi:glutamate carboxypeptidase
MSGASTNGAAPAASEILPRLEKDGDRFREALRRVVEAESPSADLDAVRRCAAVVAEVGEELLGKPPTRLDVEGVPHLLWEAAGEPVVGVIGHFDTVHPVGGLALNPFRIEDGWAYGPGIMDMKAGVVQALAALSLVGLEGVTVLLTADEELGSQTSWPLVEDLGRQVEVALVPEPSFAGALKTARKGSATWDVEVRGREAHAGLEPEDGINATLVLAHAAIAIAALADGSRGTTVTPTTASSGGAGNIVPGYARLHVDCRAWTPEELERVEAGLLALEPALPGASLSVQHGPRRPPLQEEQSRPLFELAQDVARRAGLGELTSAAVGGGSDGSLTAGIGTPTLDGLGAVGEGAHTSNERIRIGEFLPRTALLAGLVEEIRRLRRDEPGRLEMLRSGGSR